jgi:hypothetical protein
MLKVQAIGMLGIIVIGMGSRSNFIPTRLERSDFRSAASAGALRAFFARGPRGCFIIIECSAHVIRF